MTKSRIGGFVVATALVALAQLPANAAPILQVNGGGILTGVQGLDVGGTPYDVTLTKGSCLSVFAGCTAFTFTSLSEALDASQAFADEISTSPFATDIFDIQGCFPSPSSSCAYRTPYATILDINQTLFVLSDFAQFFNDGSNVVDVSGFRDASVDPNIFTGGTWLVWSQASSIPEPLTISLSALVLLVLPQCAAVGRRPPSSNRSH